MKDANKKKLHIYLIFTNFVALAKKNPKSRCTVHKSQGFVNHNY